MDRILLYKIASSACKPDRYTLHQSNTGRVRINFKNINSIVICTIALSLGPFPAFKVSMLHTENRAYYVEKIREPGDEAIITS